MSDKINVQEILKKHIGSRDIYDDRMKAAIKEIVEAVVDKCAKEAKTKDLDRWGDFVVPDEDSIVQVKQMVNYD